jgi:AraC-like DNA-binding protein
MQRIVGYVTRVETQRALASALEGRAHLDLVVHREQVCAAAERAPTDLVVTELVDAADEPVPAALVTQWRERLGVPVVAIARAQFTEVRHIARIVRAGASEIAILGIDDVRTSLTNAMHGRDTPDGATRAAAGRILGDRGLPLVDLCLREAGRSSSVKRLAVAVGVSGKTLTRRFHDAGLGNPGLLLRWIRVLLTLETLQRPGVTLKRASVQFGFASTTAFRETLSQLTGMRPTQARTADGFERALVRFRYALRGNTPLSPTEHEPPAGLEVPHRLAPGDREIPLGRPAFPLTQRVVTGEYYRQHEPFRVRRLSPE